MVDPLDAERLELGDLRGRDRAAAAAEDADVVGAALAQHVDHVAEVLVVPALVGADGDRVGVLLDRRAHDVGDAAVVAEVDHLGALRLDQPAHDVDRRVVAVEERCGGDEAQRRPRRISTSGSPLLDGDARHPTPSSRKERVSFSISRAITIRWISCVPS